MQINEVDLIRAAQRGDLNSFNRLVLAYQEMVYGLAYRMMGEGEIADDTTQDVFISAFRNIGSFRGGSFKAWLLRITTNACYDELRRRKRRPTVPLEPLDDNDEEIESPTWLADPGESPEEAAERAELSRAIQHCLSGLPPEFRSIVILVDIQGMDYTEAAQSIGKPLGTVKSRLARGRLRLRECLKGVWELLPTGLRLVEESER